MTHTMYNFKPSCYKLLDSLEQRGLKDRVGWRKDRKRDSQECHKDLSTIIYKLHSLQGYSSSSSRAIVSFISGLTRLGQSEPSELRGKIPLC